jgi:capsid protein
MNKSLKKAQDKRAELIAKIQSINLQKRIDRMESGDPAAAYDPVDTNRNTGQRRQPRIEMTNESGILNARTRLQIINLCRDTERNSSIAKSMIRQFKINVVGELAKLQLNTDSEEINRTVNTWFNSVYSNNCDSHGFQHWTDILKNTLAAVIREGDFVITVDTFNRRDGKIVIFEADQIVNMSKKDWDAKEKFTKDMLSSENVSQEDGIVYDSWGRELAYIVTGKRGTTMQDAENLTILPAEQARLVRNTFRPNQGRGNGEFFSVVADIEDIYEMRGKEIQTAKVGATFAAIVKKTDAIEDAAFRGGEIPEELYELPDDTPIVETPQKQYESLGMLEGGATEYMEPGEEFDIVDFDRPNVKMQEFYERVAQGAGAALGLAKAYTRLEAYNSYTAFRGEMVMTWQTFYSWQKFIERNICDFVAEKAIPLAIENGELNVNLPDGWERMISWSFPYMPQVDPIKDNQGWSGAIKEGFLGYQDKLGPNWKAILTNYSNALKEAAALGFNLTAFETKTGGIIETTTSRIKGFFKNDK